MKKIISIVIGFFHDFAAGCWAATLLAVYWLNKHPLPSDPGGIVLGMKKNFFYFGVACAILVFATGAGRTFTYVTDVFGKDAEKMRRTMLIVKHIVLLVIFGTGTYWQYTTVFH
jgi:putative copper export protein